MSFNFRKATIKDEAAMNLLIKKSAKVINASFYSDKEIEAALGSAW